VSHASVAVDGQEVGLVDSGLLILLGVSSEDTDDDCAYLTDRILGLRIFPDENGRFDRSSLDVGADLLVISQFTLYADTRRGRRPDFQQAAPPAEAERLYEMMLEELRRSGLKVASGRFGEYMRVELCNEGPVTIMLDTADRQRPRRG
jgi:D-tyrosyl-tRNA(Tyr) deacylase